MLFIAFYSFFFCSSDLRYFYLSYIHVHWFFLLAVQICCWPTLVGFSFQLLYFLPFYFFLTLYISLFIFSLYIVFLDFLSFLSKIFFSSLSIFRTACLTSWSSVNEFCPRTIRNTRALFGGLIGIAIQKQICDGNLICVLMGKEKGRVYKDRKRGLSKGLSKLLWKKLDWCWQVGLRGVWKSSLCTNKCWEVY